MILYRVGIQNGYAIGKKDGYDECEKDYRKYIEDLEKRYDYYR